MLYCAADNIFLAADQVLAKITPNISVWAVDPKGDPLGLYIRSLGELKQRHPGRCPGAAGPSAAVLRPAHPRDELIAHHEKRCAVIADACRTAPRSAAELVPVLFPRPLDPHQMSFAFSEMQAHVNYMLRRGELAWAEADGGVERVVTSQSCAGERRPGIALSRETEAHHPLGACKGTEPPSSTPGERRLSLVCSTHFALRGVRGAPGFTMQARQYVGKLLGQIFRNQPDAEGVGAFAVQPRRGAGGLECGHALGEQAGDEAREHVAGAGGGEPGRRVVVDGGAAVGGGDHRVRPLEDDDGAADGRGLARAVELGAGKIAEQAVELALVRGQHHRGVPRLDGGEQHLRRRVGLGLRTTKPRPAALTGASVARGEGGEGVGVEHGGGGRTRAR